MTDLFKVTYGSHLYGTSTPTSDLDEKVVYLPPLEDVLLSKKLRTYKTRVDAEGNPVSDTAQMPDGGVEVEYVPFQTFCRDFLNGQTYALECAFAHLSAEPVALYWVKELVEKFLTCNVSSMAGFAKKQTFDYVHRGVRLEKAKRLLVALNELLSDERDGFFADVANGQQLRLDHVKGTKVLHVIAKYADLELGTTVNNGREMRTLKLNGREYLETTTVEHLRTAVQKLVDSYGHRTQAAAEAEVDRKSLMHAVRVYEQALELLRHGKLTFPRPEVERQRLLLVKTTMPLEDAKMHLLKLEEELTEAQKTSTLLPEKTPELEAAFEQWLLEELRFRYGLPPFA